MGKVLVLALCHQQDKMGGKKELQPANVDIPAIPRTGSTRRERAVRHTQKSNNVSQQMRSRTANPETQQILAKL